MPATGLQSFRILHRSREGVPAMGTRNQPADWGGLPGGHWAPFSKKAFETYYSDTVGPHSGAYRNGSISEHS